MTNKQILITTAGSHGDVLPFVALGREFQARGHEVHLYTNPHFERYVRNAGLHFTPIGTLEAYESLFHDKGSTHSREAVRRIGRYFSDILPQCYHALKAALDPGRTLLVGSTLSFAPRLLRETHGVPTVVAHLAPSAFRSNNYPSWRIAMRLFPYLPERTKRRAWAIMDSLILDPVFTRPLNRQRADLGLAPVRHVFRNWIHEADLVLGLFPEWFAKPEPEWPPKVRLSGFPFYDHDEEQPLPDAVRTFLEAGEAPVAFTAGTATAAAREFYAVSAEACRQAGRRGILLTHFAEQVPHPLPRDIVHFGYVPFGALLPKLAAFVHHGGIGSTAQALRAGVPQLIRPMAYDQFDNARRTVELGVARKLSTKEYKPTAVAQALGELMDDSAVKERCVELARRLSGDDAIARACDVILKEL